jgi:hypothetical protein
MRSPRVRGDREVEIVGCKASVIDVIHRSLQISYSALGAWIGGNRNLLNSAACRFDSTRNLVTVATARVWQQGGFH